MSSVQIRTPVVSEKSKLGSIHIHRERPGNETESLGMRLRGLGMRLRANLKCASMHCTIWVHMYTHVQSLSGHKC